MCVCVCVCMCICVCVCVCGSISGFFLLSLLRFFPCSFSSGSAKVLVTSIDLSLKGFYCPTKVFDLLCCLLLLLEALLPRSKKWNLFKGFKPFYTGVLIVDGALKLSQNYSNYCYVLSVSSLL